MADNDGIYGLAKKVIPPRARFYAQTLLGDRTKPFTQDDLTPDELRHIHAAVEASRERLQDRIERIKNAESYSDISMSGIYPRHIENNPVLKNEKDKFSEFKAFNAKNEQNFKKGYGNVQYGDYKPNSPMSDTLGRFTYQIQPDGTVHVSDKYDFYNDAREPRVKRFEQENPVLRALDAGTLAAGEALSGEFRNAAGIIGEAYIGRDGRPVDIKYHPDIFKPKETTPQAPVGNPMGDAYKKGGTIVKPLAGGRKTI
jgi:hypothetical protein